MKYVTTGLILTLLLTNRAVFPQRLVNLQECYDLAIQQSAISAEKEIYNSIWELKDKNLVRSWLPDFETNLSYVYNSDVVDMTEVFSGLPIPGIDDAVPLMPHQAYKLTLDLNQLIYDGGSVKKARNVEEANLKVNRQKVESDLYSLKGQVTQVFFSILLLERQEELLHVYEDLIDRQMNSIRSGVDNGVLLKSDLDVMMSEKINLEQQLTEIELKKISLQDVLSDLTGLENGTGFILEMPQVSAGMTTELARPELRAIDFQIDQIEAGKDLMQTDRMPKAFGFATLAVGSPPGNNFFESDISPFYIVGAGIKWNIYDWGKVKFDKQQANLQQSILQGRKADLADNLGRSLRSKEAEIASLQASLARDTELIELRKRIARTAESQYLNGTITASELLHEINAGKQAEINYELHKISLEKAKVEYLNINGKELK